MRLTNNIRGAIIKSILDDTPKIDYDEEITKVVQTALYDLADPLMKRVYDDASLRGLIRDDPICYVATGIHTGNNVYVLTEKAIPPSVIDECKRLEELDNKQTAVRNKLRVSLSALLKSFNTLEKLQKDVPEFEKYLQKGSSATTEFKVVSSSANVLVELMKAGWPKDKAKA